MSVFDPLKHPRDTRGRWSSVLNDLKKGESASLPDGIHVKKGSGEFHVHMPDGSRHKSFKDAATAGDHALAVSAGNNHEKSLGGNKRHPNLPTALKRNRAVARRESRKAEAAGAKAERMKRPVGETKAQKIASTLQRAKSEAAHRAKTSKAQPTPAGRPSDAEVNHVHERMRAMKPGQERTLRSGAKVKRHANSEQGYPIFSAHHEGRQIAQGMGRHVARVALGAGVKKEATPSKVTKPATRKTRTPGRVGSASLKTRDMRKLSDDQLAVHIEGLKKAVGVSSLARDRQRQQKAIDAAKAEQDTRGTAKVAGEQAKAKAEAPKANGKIKGARKMQVAGQTVQVKPVENPIYKGEGHGAAEVYDEQGNKLGEVRSMTGSKDGPKIGMGGVVAWRKSTIDWGVEKGLINPGTSRSSRKGAIEALLKGKQDEEKALERFRAMSDEELQAAKTRMLKMGGGGYKFPARVMAEREKTSASTADGVATPAAPSEPKLKKTKTPKNTLGGVRAALKKSHTPTKTTTTSVKGWHNQHAGYSVQAGPGGALHVHHIPSSTITKPEVVEARAKAELDRYEKTLKDAGFETERVKPTGPISIKGDLSEHHDQLRAKLKEEQSNIDYSDRRLKQLKERMAGLPYDSPMRKSIQRDINREQNTRNKAFIRQYDQEKNAPPTGKYVPKGRTDESSYDYTDDPQQLASKFSREQLQAALNHGGQLKFDYEENVPEAAIREALASKSKPGGADFSVDPPAPPSNPNHYPYPFTEGHDGEHYVDTPAGTGKVIDYGGGHGNTKPYVKVEHSDGGVSTHHPHSVDAAEHVPPPPEPVHEPPPPPPPPPTPPALQNIRPTRLDALNPAAGDSVVVHGGDAVAHRVEGHTADGTQVTHLGTGERLTLPKHTLISAHGTHAGNVDTATRARFAPTEEHSRPEPSGAQLERVTRLLHAAGGEGQKGDLSVLPAGNHQLEAWVKQGKLSRRKRDGKTFYALPGTAVTPASGHLGH